MYIRQKVTQCFFGQPFVKGFAVCYRIVVPSVCLSVLSCLSVCTVGVLWPYGQMDQDATWYSMLDGDPDSPLPPKRGQSSPQFSAYVYFGQTAGWIRIPLVRRYRPWPTRHCVRWGPSSPYGKGHSSPHFLAHFALARSPISATAELLLWSPYGIGQTIIFLP